MDRMDPFAEAREREAAREEQACMDSEVLRLEAQQRVAEELERQAEKRRRSRWSHETSKLQRPWSILDVFITNHPHYPRPPEQDQVVMIALLVILTILFWPSRRRRQKQPRSTPAGIAANNAANNDDDCDDNDEYDDEEGEEEEEEQDNSNTSWKTVQSQEE